MTSRFYDCCSCAARLLQRKPVQVVCLRQRVRLAAQVVTDLVHFATQPQNQRCRNVWMMEHARQRALQLLGIGPDRVSAAFAVGKGDNAIHIRRQRFSIEAASDLLSRMRSAITGRDDCDVVARPHSPIRAAVS